MKRKRINLIVLLVFLCIVPLRGWVNTQQENYKNAQLFEQKGQYAKAESLYVNLYTENPNNYNYYNRYKNILIRQRKYDDLVPLLEDRLLKRDYDRYLRLEVGVLYYVIDKKPKALNLWKDVFGSQAKNMKDPYANAIYYDVLAYGQGNRFYEIVKDLRKITKDPRLLVNQNFSMSLKYRNWEDAVSEIIHILDTNTDDLKYIRSNLFRFDPDADLYKYAIDVLKDHESPESRIIRSDIYSHIGDFEAAYAILSAAVNDKLIHAAIRNFANRMFGQSEYELAFKAALQAEKLMPDEKTKRSMALLAARAQEKIFDRQNEIVSIIPYPYDSKFLAIKFRPFDPETADIIKSAYGSYDSLSQYPDESGNLASFRHADITYRVFQDFDQAMTEYRQLLPYSGGAERQRVISRICDLYMARGEFKKALAFCADAPEKFQLMVREEDQLSVHQFYVSLMAGESDSLAERTRAVLALLKEDDPDYNDILAMSAVLNTVMKDSVNYSKWLEAERYLLQNKTSSAIDIYKKLIENDTPAKKIYALRYLDCLNSRRDREGEGKFWEKHYADLLETDMGDYFMLRYAGYMEKMQKFDISYEIFQKYLLSYRESMYFEQIREHVRQHYSPGTP